MVGVRVGVGEESRRERVSRWIDGGGEWVVHKARVGGVKWAQC